MQPAELHLVFGNICAQLCCKPRVTISSPLSVHWLWGPQCGLLLQSFAQSILNVSAGATVHFVDEHYDTGPILSQSIVPVLPEDTPSQLAARVLQTVSLSPVPPPPPPLSSKWQCLTSALLDQAPCASILPRQCSGGPMRVGWVGHKSSATTLVFAGSCLPESKSGWT